MLYLHIFALLAADFLYDVLRTYVGAPWLHFVVARAAAAVFVEAKNSSYIIINQILAFSVQSSRL